MVPLFIGGAFVYAISVGGGYLYWKVKTSSKTSGERGYCSSCSVSQRDILDAYDSGAKNYDNSIDWVEYISIDGFRKDMIRRYCKPGEVLEVAVGTGRNFKHYDPTKNTVVAVDASEKMLEEARKKIKETPVRVETDLVDAHGLSKRFGERRFDVVIDTFGLCSFNDPVRVLKEMSRVCKADGKILLLEHGRSAPQHSKSLSRWLGGDWLSSVLDVYAEKHAKQWGCWWNRDIVQLVEEAGLGVIEVETHQMGTLYVVVCEPIAEP